MADPNQERETAREIRRLPGVLVPGMAHSLCYMGTCLVYRTDNRVSNMGTGSHERKRLLQTPSHAPR